MRHRLTVPLAALLAAAWLAAACSDDDGGSPEALCRVVADRDHTSVFDGGFDPTDTARAAAQLDAALVDLDELRTAAPSELRDALDDERRYLEQLREVLDATDPDDPAAVVAAVNDLDEDRAAAEAAALQLAAFEAEHCTAGATSPSSTATSAPAASEP